LQTDLQSASSEKAGNRMAVSAVSTPPKIFCDPI
jgi:hypothetical protein